jgi:hypothetical protein
MKANKTVVDTAKPRMQMADSAQAAEPMQVAESKFA